MPLASVGDVELHHEFHGEPDAPRVLVISGSGNDLRRSLPERHPLNREFRTLHYDQRGLGRSSIPEGPYEMADYAADAVGLLDAVGWDRCHVVGVSFGGMVAQHVAIDAPRRVDRLVLACTSPGGTKPSFPLHVLAGLDAEAALELRLGLLDNRWDPGRDDPIPGLGPFYDRLIDDARRERSEEERRGNGLQLDARSRHDVERRLGRIRAETLVAAGLWDDLAPLANSEALAAGIPGARLQTFDGGHLFMLQDRSAWPAVAEFLRDGHPG